MPQLGAGPSVVAKLLDLTVQRVGQLVREGILPPPRERGRYDVVACVRAYVRHLRARLSGGAHDLLTERARLARAHAQRVELDVKIRTGALVPADDLGRALDYFVTSTRSRLLSFPRRLAVVLSPENPKVMEEKLTRAVEGLLEELATEPLPDWVQDDDENAGGNGKAPARANGGARQ